MHFEDVLHGMLQQRQRLDIAGKVVSLRLAGYIVTYLITYIFYKELGCSIIYFTFNHIYNVFGIKQHCSKRVYKREN